MLNSKEKRANLIALIVATLILIGGPYNWLSQNLSTGATVRIVLNFLTYLIAAVLVWWGVQNFNRMRPRQFWETGFRWWLIVFVYGYLVASSEWWIFLSCLPVPLAIWLFYFSTDRHAAYLDSLATPPTPQPDPAP